jgi:hypothetical protein
MLDIVFSINSKEWLGLVLDNPGGFLGNIPTSFLALIQHIKKGMGMN